MTIIAFIAGFCLGAGIAFIAACIALSIKEGKKMTSNKAKLRRYSSAVLNAMAIIQSKLDFEVDPVAIEAYTSELKDLEDLRFELSKGF